jgi:hypothetical protein
MNDQQMQSALEQQDRLFNRREGGGVWIRDVELAMSTLTDRQIQWLLDDEAGHLTIVTDVLHQVSVCPGSFCHLYQESRRIKGLDPDPDHTPMEESGRCWLIWEAAARGWCVYPDPIWQHPGSPLDR